MKIYKVKCKSCGVQCEHYIPPPKTEEKCSVDQNCPIILECDKMNKNDEIKAQIKQNKVDQEAVAEKGRELEAELRSAKKPRARNGDYGYCNVGRAGNPYLYVKGDGDVLHLVGKSMSYPECAYNPDCHTITGNIFDDLKRNAEDLREFAIGSQPEDLMAFAIGSEPLEAKIVGKSIKFKIHGMQSTRQLSEAKKIHQALGRLIATAERGKK